MGKYEGLMPIVTKVKRISYKVVTLEWMKMHLVFHVGNLKPYYLNDEDLTCNNLARTDVDIKLSEMMKEAEEILIDRVRYVHQHLV